MKRSSYPQLLIKAGRDVALKNRHPAIFKTSVEKFPETEDGSIVEVRSAQGEFLCYATLNRRAYVCARAFAFEEGDPLQSLRKSMESAIDLRERFFASEDTTAYRLINAEGDGIPGLVADRYGDILVVQYTTLGMDKLSDFIIEILDKRMQPKGIFEKSRGFARQKEGVEKREGWVKGSGDAMVIVKERGMFFQVNLIGGQKTGLFLDQREMRSLVRSIASGRTVLDCFSYVGGFALSALLGEARFADAVDSDGKALERLKENMALNGIREDRFSVECDDVFDVLRRKPQKREYDFIILDPPAFAKRSSDLDQAKRAYTDLNRLAMQILPAGGLLLTCSCSYQVNPEIFQTIVFHAARQAKRFVRILERHRQAFDHPVSLAHPEGDYLKSLLLAVE